MTITLDLPEDLQKELSAAARKLDLSLADYILRLLTTVQPLQSMPTSGAELISYWQNEGLIGTRLDSVDSAEYARKIRRRAEEGRARE
jgi:hypothetical protein